MPRYWIALCAIAAVFSATGILSEDQNSSIPKASAIPPSLALHTQRMSPSDLELGGEIVGLPPGAIRYITRDDLLTLPQVTYTVADDANFAGPTEVSGVPLEELTSRLAAAPKSDMAVAICSDQYRANYPHAYVIAHHPLLVLKINGQPPSGWPKDRETQTYDMGPFLISHPNFTPAFKIFSHPDEAQIPWGVVRLEFRNEKKVFAAIAPLGVKAADAHVQAGYRIAQQNCFRCHNMEEQGGMKAGRPWPVLSAWASSSPKYFADYVRNPQSRNPQAQMPGNPYYDDATIGALISYFRTFSIQNESPQKKPQSQGKP